MKSPRLFLTGLLLALAATTARPAADDGWVSLFDGETLNGWKAAEHPDSFTVVNGMIRGEGPRAHLFYVGADGHAEFENFELELEAKADGGANSGVYFHATWQDKDWPRQSGIEVQVNNTQPPFGNNYSENKKTGSLYGFRNLYKAMARDGEWFTMNIQVRKPRVQVRLNGRLMIDYIEPTNVPVLVAGATRDQLTQGTFALQCHDEKSQISYRHIRVRRLPPGVDATVARSTYTPEDLRRIVLARDNFPLLNLRTHLGDGLSLAQLHAIRNQTGLFAGLVYSLNPAGPVWDDTTARALIAATKETPVFLGLEMARDGELGDEHGELPLGTLALFDYVVGHRLVDDVQPGDGKHEQALMDYFVRQIVGCIETAPIDIYANVMILPKGFAQPAEAMWTEERMQRVITAAVKNGVALEINPRERTPSEKFIGLAKAAGAKFTVGSDAATAAEFTDWSYILEIQQKLKLGWRDMWVPGHAPTRAQRALAQN